MAGKYHVEWGRESLQKERGVEVEYEPESPSTLKDVLSTAPCACVNIASICGHVNRANTRQCSEPRLAKQRHSSLWLQNREQRTQAAQSEQQKHQWCYLHVQGRAGVLSCSPPGGSPLPLGDTVSDLIPSRTWTWAYCPGQMDVALRKSGWKFLDTQNQFAPDIHWLWPVS